jgi:hypothetical protein
MSILITLPFFGGAVGQSPGGPAKLPRGQAPAVTFSSGELRADSREGGSCQQSR